MLPLSFIAGFLGGLSFDALGIPLPYLLGSLCACALLSLKGWCAPLPKPGLRLGQLTIGLALGLYFTAHVLDALANIMGWVIVSGALSALLSLAGAAFIQRRTGLDANTCFFATVIGGASNMANQAAEAGGRGDLVALAHTIRVSLVVSIAPFLALWFSDLGYTTPSALGFESHKLNLLMNGLLVLAGLISAFASQQLRLPNPWVLGPILAGGLFAVYVQEGQLDTLLLIVGQVFLGWNLGQRFSAKAIKDAPVLSLNVVVLTFCYGLAGLAMALLAQWGAGLNWASAFVATTPGGIAEMALTAKLLGLDSPAVTAFHVVRLVIVVATSHYLIRLCLQRGWLIPTPYNPEKNGEQPHTQP